MRLTHLIPQLVGSLATVGVAVLALRLLSRGAGRRRVADAPDAGHTDDSMYQRSTWPVAEPAPSDDIIWLVRP